MSAILWIRGCCSRWRSKRSDNIRLWWVRIWSIFQNTSEMNPGRRSSDITGGDAFLSGSMKTLCTRFKDEMSRNNSARNWLSKYLFDWLEVRHISFLGGEDFKYNGLSFDLFLAEGFASFKRHKTVPLLISFRQLSCLETAYSLAWTKTEWWCVQCYTTPCIELVTYDKSDNSRDNWKSTVGFANKTKKIKQKKWPSPLQCLDFRSDVPA